MHKPWRSFFNFSNVQGLTKFGVGSISLQNLNICSLAHARKSFAVGRKLGFSIAQVFVNRALIVGIWDRNKCIISWYCTGGTK